MVLMAQQEGLTARLILASTVVDDKAVSTKLVLVASRITAAEQSGYANALDTGQIGLDALGLVPGVGEIADLVNSLVSLARGDYMGAALSLISTTPVAGDAVGKGGKLVIWLARLAKREGRLGNAAKTIVKHGPQIRKIVRQFSTSVVKHKSTIKSSMQTLSQVVSSTDNENAPAHVKAVAKVVSKSPKLKGMVQKAQPLMNKMQSAVNNIIQLAEVSDDTFTKLEQQARQTVSRDPRAS